MGPHNRAAPLPAPFIRGQRPVTPTPRQAELLRYIAGYQEAHGYSPSFREMAVVIGVNSLNKFQAIIDGLVWRGWLRRLPNRARAIELLTPVTIPRAPDGAPLYHIRVA
jgi:repressor LexA